MIPMEGCIIINVLDIVCDRFCNHAMPCRCGVGVAVLNDLLYAVGGHDGQSYLNSIER